MKAIDALIERMGQAPQEFVEDGNTRGTRWEHITDAIYEENKTKPCVFTQEEIDAYMEGIVKLIRAQLEEQICIEILNPLRPDRGEQMELFPAQTAYPPGRPMTVKQITADALKILEQELEKPKKLII